jgi:exopolysaccharide production protein ExoF
VTEWCADKGGYFDCAPLSHEYAVNAAGVVAPPLLGELTAVGTTTAEFAMVVAETLRRRAGPINCPDTLVEIIQFRPVYIVGAVERLREYAFRHGLSVLQAVGIAGSLYGPDRIGLMLLECDVITALGASCSCAGRTSKQSRTVRPTSSFPLNYAPIQIRVTRGPAQPFTSPRG